MEGQITAPGVPRVLHILMFYLLPTPLINDPSRVEVGVLMQGVHENVQDLV